jgi:hypothetical protein
LALRTVALPTAVFHEGDFALLGGCRKRGTVTERAGRKDGQRGTKHLMTHDGASGVSAVASKH